MFYRGCQAVIEEAEDLIPLLPPHITAFTSSLPDIATAAVETRDELKSPGFGSAGVC